MPLKPIKKDEFAKILKLKEREYVIPDYAKARASKRFFNTDTFKKDLENSNPAHIFEQEHDVPDERKFDIYYKQNDDFYHRYIIVIK